MKTYAIKNKGKYLCEFMLKKGYDYRSKQEVSYFSSLIFSTKKEDLEGIQKCELGIKLKNCVTGETGLPTT